MANKKSLSLLEILVSIIILSLVLIGLANLFVASRRYVLHARLRMSGGEIGRLFLDPLQMQVRQDTWDDPTTNALSLTGDDSYRYCDCITNHPKQPGGFCPSSIETTLGSVEYSARYEITSQGSLRKVNLRVTWLEPS